MPRSCSRNRCHPATHYISVIEHQWDSIFKWHAVKVCRNRDTCERCFVFYAETCGVRNYLGIPWRYYGVIGLLLEYATVYNYRINENNYISYIMYCTDVTSQNLINIDKWTHCIMYIVMLCYVCCFLFSATIKVCVYIYIYIKPESNRYPRRNTL